MIIFNQKKTSAELHAAGLVGTVYPDAQFAELAMAKADAVAALPPNSLRSSKRITRPPALVEHLKKVNRAEREMLDTRWGSDECMEGTRVCAISCKVQLANSTRPYPDHSGDAVLHAETELNKEKTNAKIGICNAHDRVIIVPNRTIIKAGD